MPSSGAWVSVLHALSALQVAMSAGITDLICKNPSDYNADARFDMGGGQMTTCGNVVATFLSPYSDKTTLTPEECRTIANPQDGTTLEKGFMFLATRCCGTGAPNYPCGWIWPNFQPCASVDDFKPGAAASMGMHCSGDEAVMDKATCIAAGGEDAWEEAGDEQCDVGRMEATYVDKEAACAKLGGTWGHYNCLDVVMHMGEQMTTEHTCSDPVAAISYYPLSMVYEQFAHCCKAPSTRCTPPDYNICADPSEFTPDAIAIEMVSCKEMMRYVYNQSKVTDFCDLGTAAGTKCTTTKIHEQGTVAESLGWWAAKCCSSGSALALGPCSTNGCPTTTTTTTTTTAPAEDASEASHVYGALTPVAAAATAAFVAFGEATGM